MKMWRTLGWCFGGPGAAMLILAAVLAVVEAASGARAQSATGDVVEVIQSGVSRDKNGRNWPLYSSHIRFRTTGGRVVDFVETLETSPPRHAVGQRVTLLYDPRDPAGASVDDLFGRYFASLILGALGLVFAVLGLAFRTAFVLATRRIRRLRSDGRPIEAGFVGIATDFGVRRNGRPALRVIVEGRDSTTGETRRFKSERIWVDPSAELVGRKLRVLLSPGGHDYLVDLRGVVDETAVA